MHHFSIFVPHQNLWQIDTIASIRIRCKKICVLVTSIKKSDIEGIMEEVTEELNILAEEAGGADAQPPSGDDNV